MFTPIWEPQQHLFANPFPWTIKLNVADAGAKVVRDAPRARRELLERGEVTLGEVDDLRGVWRWRSSEGCAAPG